MFASAIKKAIKFTRAVVVSRRAVDGTCKSGIGAYLIINAEGWIVTAAHILEEVEKLGQSKQSFNEYEQARSAIETDKKLSAKQKKRAIKKLGKPDKLVRNYSPWWSYDGVNLVDAKGLGLVDLAIGRLEPFESGWVQEYPVFKDPEQALDSGTSLCRLGFPLHKIEPAFDESKGGFVLPEGSVPPPFFPIEGICTRHIHIDEHPSGFPLAYLETSSPGLKGQSGGPIFDQQGTVWAIQSQTKHFELGFTPKAAQAGRKQVEHQFLNVGWGVHPATLVGFLDAMGVDYEKSSY